MSLALAVVFSGSLAAVVLLAIFLSRHVRRADEHEASLDWAASFSVARYRPMLRLLSSEDYDFLREQYGYTPSMIRKLRKERRRIFREYLRNLERDFSRLEATAHAIMVSATEDKSEFASKLLATRIAFLRALLAIRVRLVLDAAGLATVDARTLLQPLEQMQAAVQLAPAAR